MEQIYGKLTIISPVRSGGCGLGKLVDAICECGTIKEYRLRFIKSGHTTSCGCIVAPHGYYRHPLYKVWMCIKERCCNENHAAYHYYGGRGITICPEWIYDAKAFIEWSLANGWTKDLEIDRRENDGPYAPWNCRFVTTKVNMRNRRSTVMAEMGGVKKSLAEWAEDYNMHLETVKSRLKRGYDLLEALTFPLEIHKSSIRCK